MKRVTKTELIVDVLNEIRNAWRVKINEQLGQWNSEYEKTGKDFRDPKYVVFVNNKATKLLEDILCNYRENSLYNDVIAQIGNDGWKMIIC